MSGPTITVLIDLPPAQSYRRATFEALDHATSHAGVAATVNAMPTDEIDNDFLANLGDGIIMGPGSPYANPEAAEDVIRLARERGIPLVGT